MSRPNSIAPPTESAPPRPLRADAERNRQRVIAAAQELFAERGLSVTLDDIAHRAGVGVGTAYRRFAGREELVETVFEGEVQHMITLAERSLAHEDPWEGFVEFFVAAATQFTENRGLRQVLVEGAHGKSAVAAARGRLTPAIGAVIARAQRDGRLRDDIEVTDFPLLQLMIGAVDQHCRNVTPDIWQRYLVLLLDGLRRDRSAPSPFPAPALDQDGLDRTVT